MQNNVENDIIINNNIRWKRKNMTTEDKIIIVKGKNRTLQIKSFEDLYNGKIKIVYKDDKEYTYNSSNILILDDNITLVMNYLKEISLYVKDMQKFFEGVFSRFLKVDEESVLFNYLQSQPLNRLSDKFDLIFPFGCNLSQRDAVEKAFFNNISVIEGPPGTGKTQTILNIIANIVGVQGKSVAVASNNNEAIKNVRDKLKKYGYEFMVALLGNKENREVFFENIPVVPDISSWNCKETVFELNIKISELNTILSSLMDAERRKAVYEQQLREWELERQYFDDYYEKWELNSIEKLPAWAENSDKIISFLAESQIAKESKHFQKLLKNLKLLIRYKLFTFKHLRKFDVEAILMLQRNFYVQKIEAVKNDIAKIEEYLKKTSYDEIRQKHEDCSAKLFKKRIYEQYTNLNQIDFTVLNYTYEFNDFVKKYPVILSTTFSLRDSIPQGKLVDYLIIDESSQVDLLAGALALSCCRNVVIVGDLKQLPQIVDKNIKEKLTCQMPNAEYDYFEQNILSSVLDVYGDTIPRTILKEHYRCHPDIIEFCNRKYYNGELISYTSQDISDNPLVIYKTVKGNHTRTVTRGESKGSYNQRELDVTVEEVLKNPDVNYQDIGFVTPYRKQADKASELLDEKIQSDTVHKYQGREKNMIIMSTVLDRKSATERRIEFVDDPHLINVAVSRAIKKFVLVTDNKLFFDKGQNINELIRYMRYKTLDEAIIQSNITSVFDLLYDEYSAKLIDIKKRMNSDARYPSEEAIRVLLTDILARSQYNTYYFTEQVYLFNILNSQDMLNEEEKKYVKNRASVDFVVYRRIDKSVVLVIEVDGFAFHENNPKQKERDKKKDLILSKYGINLLRLPTNGSKEEDKILHALDDINIYMN